MSKTYNYIYEQLVKSPDDIQGIIAYSVYKRQKIDFISNFEQEHEREINESDIEQFNKISTSAPQLQFYRDSANTLMQAFLIDVLNDDLEEREKLFSKRLDDEIKSFKPKFWRDAFTGAFGSFLFVILTGTAYFTLAAINVGPKEIIETVFNVTITNR